MAQKDVARYFHVGRSTVSSIIPDVCNAIWDELSLTEMPVPDAEQWRKIAKEFEERWNFHNCLGMIKYRMTNAHRYQKLLSYFITFRLTIKDVTTELPLVNLTFAWCHMCRY